MQDPICILLLILYKALTRNLNMEAEQTKKKHVKTPPVYLFSTIWSQVESGQPNRKNQRASFLQFPPSCQSCK